MSARTGLWMLIAGSVLAMVIAVFRGAPAPHEPKPPAPRVHERPWLSHEAMLQLVAPNGGPGPLFADLTLGGPAPAPATRKRIAEFAHANAIEIHLDIADAELAAIRVGVTFGGCCGYEGADAFGRLLHRKNLYTCCDCGPTPANEWSTASDDGVAIHGRVAVNRIDVRWEAILTLRDLLDRAEQIAGKSRATVRTRAGDRWHDHATDAVLDVPYPFAPEEYGSDDGLHLEVERGRIAEVSFTLHDVDTDELATKLRARWGRPRVVEDTWTWRTAERAITVESGSTTTISIRANAPAPTTALARAAATPAPRS